MSDTITVPRVVLEQALTTLEGWGDYDKWVWPESALFTAKKNTAEMITALRAALEQQQVEQEPVAWIRGLPEEATHIAAAKAKVRSGGQIDISIRAFKYDDGVLMVYVTDNDNEYPGWRKAADAFYHLNFPVIPISTHPQPPRQPLTREDIAFIAAACGGLASDFVVSVARAIEAAHGVKGRK